MKRGSSHLLCHWPTHLQLLLDAENLGDEHVLLSSQLLPLELLPLGLLVSLRELAVKPVQGRVARSTHRAAHLLFLGFETNIIYCSRGGVDRGSKGTKSHYGESMTPELAIPGGPRPLLSSESGGGKDSQHSLPPDHTAGAAGAACNT